MNLWDFKVSLVYIGLYSEFQARQNYIVKLYLKKLNSLPGSKREAEEKRA